MRTIGLNPKTVRDNEAAAALAFQQGHHIQVFLLLHALTESLLRVFLDDHSPKSSFSDLIRSYGEFLFQERYPRPEFVTDLTEFNRRRNRIIHDLWRKGYTLTNQQAELAAATAMMTYGLFIDWLSTFDDSISYYGFQVNG